MIFRNRDGLRLAVTANLVAAIVCPVTLRVAAGEKTAIGERIQFSSANDVPELPLRRPGDNIPFRQFEFLDRNNSISGVVEPLALPAPGSYPSLPQNKKLRELFEQKLDEKKNWIYRTPDDLSRLATVNEMFGVREAEVEERSPQSRKSLERFFESKNAKPAADTAGDDWLSRNGDKPYEYDFDPDKRQSNDIGSRYSQPVDPGRIVTAGFSLSADWSGGATPQKPLNGGTGFRGERIDPARGRLDGTDNFRKLLATPGINPLVAGFDPIRLGGDTTRQAFNPIAPILPTDVSIPSLAGALSGTADNRIGSRSNPLTDQGARTLGPSSLSPAVSAPVEPAYLKPKPATTELPQRKF